APVSSMKTSFVGSRSSCPANHSRRRLCTSSRCCSSACAVFFKGDLVTVEETPQHRDRKALAAIGDQPLLDLEQRHVRAAPDQAQEIVAMRLDPAGAAVAATRRRRNLAGGLEPLHPAHCARDAHFEMRGRLIARQPTQHEGAGHSGGVHRQPNRVGAGPTRPSRAPSLSTRPALPSRSEGPIGAGLLGDLLRGRSPWGPNLWRWSGRAWIVSGDPSESRAIGSALSANARIGGFCQYFLASGNGSRALFDQADMRPSLRAKRSNPGPPPLTSDPLDCFVASLLAMTIQSDRIPLLEGFRAAKSFSSRRIRGTSFFAPMRSTSTFGWGTTSSVHCRP